MTMIYEKDLAYIHNVGFDFFAEGAAEYLLGQLESSGIKGGLVVDLGCGGGLWAHHLVRAGYRVHGIDISPDMVRMARKKVPSGRFVAASIYEAEIPDCQAITAMGEVINYICAGSMSRLRTALFRRAFKALSPGGVAHDRFCSARSPGKEGGSRSDFRRPRLVFWQQKFSEDKKRRRLNRDLTIFRRDKKRASYQRTHEVHELDLLDANQVAATLRAIGFRVRRRRDYGKLAFPPGYAALIARKP